MFCLTIRKIMDLFVLARLVDNLPPDRNASSSLSHQCLPSPQTLGSLSTISASLPLTSPEGHVHVEQLGGEILGEAPFAEE